MSKDISALIDRFESGGSVLRRAVEGLSYDHAVARPGPGAWSSQELVVHLADADAIGIDRMKRVITVDNPQLLNADEQAYVDRLHPHQQSIDDAVDAFAIGRRQFARVLRLLHDDAWQRAGTHDIVGRVTLLDLLQTYTDHVDHHLTFLKAKRAKLEGG